MQFTGGQTQLTSTRSEKGLITVKHSVETADNVIDLNLFHVIGAVGVRSDQLVLHPSVPLPEVNDEVQSGKEGS